MDYEQSLVRTEEQPFVIVNKMFLDTIGEFTAYEKLIYCLIKSHINQKETNGSAFPSMKRLAELAGVSEPTVIKAVNGLAEKGMIIKNKSFKKQSMKWRNEYIIRTYESARGIDVFANKEEGKTKKDEKPIIEIIDYLNEKADKKFRHVESNKKNIRGRLDEGYTAQDLKYVVDVKTEEWKGHPEMDKNLNPVTLFRPSHFEKYLNQKMKGGQAYGKSGQHSGGFIEGIPEF